MTYKCLVERGGIIKEITRWFDSAEYAFAWLELEGYKVFRLREMATAEPQKEAHHGRVD